MFLYPFLAECVDKGSKDVKDYIQVILCNIRRIEEKKITWKRLGKILKIKMFCGVELKNVNLEWNSVTLKILKISSEARS